MNLKVLLHPHRFMILSKLSERPMTVKELLNSLPEIPQAAMYRGVNKLEDCQMIQKVSETKVKGTTEATYGLDISMEGIELNSGSVQTYLKSAMLVFFSFVYNKISENRHDKKSYSSLKKSKFNSFEIKIKEENMKALEEEFQMLIKKYSDSNGDSYQFSTFLVSLEDEECDESL